MPAARRTIGIRRDECARRVIGARLGLNITMLRARLLRAACVTAAVSLPAGCGGSTHPASVPSLVDSTRPPYITGLAINPADRSILLATNRGLYSIDPSGRHLQTIAARVSASG